MPFKWVVIFAVVSATFPLSVFSNNLPSLVQQALKNSGISDSDVGIYVHEIGKEEPIFAVNADAPMNPASVMKLVTTFAGLEILGPAYTWKTEIYANGQLIDGVLHGDLVIKGYGDPNLNLENFWLLAHRLRK
ncbi:MAG: D-alanyl-D-alanine carboxypeptidase, partial [Nitrosomonas sp.]|nr:D-alanyl-D-alanine carboxypeptidase [Nitrosomonas sp.]